MKKVLLFTLIITALFVFTPKSYAGLETKTITFMGAQRTLVFYTPAGYTADKKYNFMVCLHGMGDNASNFASSLFPYWNQLSYGKDMIFLAIDGGDDQISDFYTPAGDEEIIAEAIKYAKENYSIDEKNIILEGFSLGGRSAFKYGLDHPEMFKGLLLNTPAFQGIRDANNDPEVSLGYNMANVSKLPIVISNGGADQAYLGIDEKMYINIVANNGMVMHQIVPGMQHTITSNANTEKYLSFIFNPAPDSLKINIINSNKAVNSLNESFNISTGFQNVGKKAITSVSININYKISGKIVPFEWSGSVEPFNSTTLEIPDLKLDTGMNIFTLTIRKINGIDISDNNESDSLYVFYQEAPLTLPTFNGFEDTDLEDLFWLLDDSGNWISWDYDDQVTRTGVYSMSMLNDILAFNNAGTSEDLISPYIDLTSAEKPELTFDLAFNYLKYTTKYFARDTIFTDTLKILISTDNGLTYKEIYSKAGADLATTATPITDATSIQACIFYPKASEWRTETIDLSEYKTANQALVRFSLVSGLGGSINIDNISFKQHSTAVEDFTTAGLSLYPIPANDNITIKTDNTISEKILKIYSATGKLVDSRTIGGNETVYSLNTANFEPGVYFIEINTNGRILKDKMIIQR
ncbi:MAG: T9SS type A sorting domain-containing protein [bacterium]